jgi:hypothetical protein
LAIGVPVVAGAELVLLGLTVEATVVLLLFTVLEAIGVEDAAVDEDPESGCWGVPP